MYRELGLLELKKNKNENAKYNLSKYLELNINATDAEIIKSYLN